VIIIRRDRAACDRGKETMDVVNSLKEQRSPRDRLIELVQVYFPLLDTKRIQVNRSIPTPMENHKLICVKLTSEIDIPSNLT
jgi:hypothetical protein